MAPKLFASGSRVEVRDAEWRLKRVDQTSDNNYLLSCDGLSEFMGRGRKLKINYRTTERIRAYAMSVLEGIEIDDLDDGQDQANDYRSLVCSKALYLSSYGQKSKLIGA